MKPILTCASIDCPERKSVCCGAPSVKAPKCNHFMCAKCHKPFKGGACTAWENNMAEVLKDKLVELVEEHFPKGHPERGRATLMMSLFYVAVLREMGEL